MAPVIGFHWPCIAVNREPVVIELKSGIYTTSSLNISSAVHSVEVAIHKVYIAKRNLQSANTSRQENVVR